jgi:hypothetical protein
MISFQGFKPSGIEKIANAMGFQGEEKDFQKFLEENPDRQAEMMRYQDIARKMVEGGYVKKLSGGAYVDKDGKIKVRPDDRAKQTEESTPKKKDIRDISSDMVTTPKLPVGAKATPFGIPTGDAGQMIPTGSGQVGTTAPKATAKKAGTTLATRGGDPRIIAQSVMSDPAPAISEEEQREMRRKAFEQSEFALDPMTPRTMDMYTASDGTVFGSGTEGRAYEKYLESIKGQLQSEDPRQPLISPPIQTDDQPATMTPDTAIDKVTAVTDALQAAQVDPDDPRAKVTAATATKSSVEDIDAAQGTAIKLENPVQREIQDGELVEPVANAEKASKFIEQIQAAEATPSEKATVQGQLASLTSNFDATNPPAWAAGALRGVQAMMAQRGMGASSIAGQAMVQAALESALPIASADAQTQASFEAQNLSNRQARAMLAAEQRATFMGMEFDQAFQARVINASKISDIANMNFTAEQQIALENSRAANTMNLANLSNRQAKVMAHASALANLDMANLSNQQQSAVMNAQNFMQRDMANLSNQQQTEIFTAQQRIQSIFTDQAAVNAAEQFNATSENQTKQFFAQLDTQISQFNAAQANAQEQFNAGEANAIEKFNTEVQNQRDQFNANNRLVIDQANAQWRRQIATADTAAINRANEINAQNLLGISNTAYNNLWQYYSDAMQYAWTSAENERDRTVKLAEAHLVADSSYDIQKLKNDHSSATSFGKLIGTFLFSSLNPLSNITDIF